jgi:hypothetical protein
MGEAMRSQTLGLVLVLATGLLSQLVSHSAVAQNAPAAPQAATPASAKDAFRRGGAAYSAGNYEAAVREWTNAYSADPRPRIQYNLSQAYERMGQLENAINALKQFVESGDPEDPTYSDANARLVALQQRLSSTGVFVQGGAEGGSILVDDQDWGRTPRPDKITTPPGNHVIVVRWPSGREFRTNVYVPAGQVVELTVPDESGAAPAKGPTAAASGSAVADASASAPGQRTPWLWYGLGTGVSATGVGLLVYGIVRGGATDKCGERNDGLLTYCNPDSEDAATRQSIAGYVSGGVLMLGGAALFVVGALSQRRDDTRAGTQCGIGLASATCTVRF